MRVTVDRLAFLAAVRSVAYLSPQSESVTLAVGHITSRGVLRVHAAAGDGGATTTITLGTPAIHRAGVAATSIAPLIRTLRSLDSEQVYLTGTTEFLSVVRVESYTDGRQQLLLRIPQTFDLQIPPDAINLTLPVAELATLINRTAWAAQRVPKGSSSLLAGLFLEVNRNRLHLTATDRIGLATGSLPLARPRNAKRWSGVLPAQVVRRWANSPTETQSLTLRLWNGMALVQVDHLQSWTRCHVGEYPPWRNLTDQPRPNVLTIPAGELLSRLRTALALADPDEPRIGLSLTSGKVRLSTHEDGLSVEEWSVEYLGEPLSLLLPGDRLARYLATLDEAQNVRLEMAGSEEPVYCRPVSGSGGFLLVPWEE